MDGWTKKSMDGRTDGYLGAELLVDLCLDGVGALGVAHPPRAAEALRDEAHVRRPLHRKRVRHHLTKQTHQPPKRKTVEGGGGA